MLDGYFARHGGADLAGAGAWLDPLCDKLFVGAVLGALHFQRGVSLGLLALIVARELIQLPMAVVYRASRGLRTLAALRLSRQPARQGSDHFTVSGHLRPGGGRTPETAHRPGLRARPHRARRLHSARGGHGKAARPRCQSANVERRIEGGPKVMNAHYWAAASLAAVAVIVVGVGGFAGAAGTGGDAGGGRTFVGGVERLDPALDALVAADARVEVLARGYKWAEGPLWKDGGLLFSDVPNNVIWRWTEKEGVREYLRPSGYTGTAPRGGEPGSNGLALDGKKRLVLCQHGDRRVARLVGPPTTAPAASQIRDHRRLLRRQAPQQPERRRGATERRRLLQRSDLRPRGAREGSPARAGLERRLPQARQGPFAGPRRDPHLPERPRLLARRQNPLRFAVGPGAGHLDGLRPRPPRGGHEPAACSSMPPPW